MLNFCHIAIIRILIKNQRCMHMMHIYCFIFMNNIWVKYESWVYESQARNIGENCRFLNFFEFLLRGASGGSRLPLAQFCDTLKQFDHFIMINYVHVWFKKEPLTRGSLEPPDAPRSLNLKNLKIGSFHQYFKLMTHIPMNHS